MKRSLVILVAFLALAMLFVSCSVEPESLIPYTVKYNANGGGVVKLYAKWTGESYEVTLNVNEGTINAGNIESYTYGVGATLPTDVTRDGYDFGGWYEDEECTGDAVTEISSTATGAKTFYAKWEEIKEYLGTWSREYNDKL